MWISIMTRLKADHIQVEHSLKVWIRIFFNRSYKGKAIAVGLQGFN
jgi:hypothetical protein